MSEYLAEVGRRAATYLIVTRHAGTVEWLAAHGVTGDVIPHATAEDVRDRHIIGILPLHLAAEAATVTAVDLPNLRPEQRGQELTPAEMDEAGAQLRSYRVARIQSGHAGTPYLERTPEQVRAELEVERRTREAAREGLPAGARAGS